MASDIVASRFVSWLKDKNLFSKVNEHYRYFSIVFNDTLKVRKRDEVLIIGDTGEEGKYSAPIMTGCYLLAAKRLGLNYKLIVQRAKCTKDVADQKLIDALRNVQEDNFITISVSGKLGSLKTLGKSFRKLVKVKRQKFVSTLNLSELPTTKFQDLVNAMNIDYRKVQSDAARLEKILTMGKEVKIFTSKGTNLTIGIRGMRAIPNDGKFLTKSGNMPVGEVYIPPRGAHVNGRVVIDGSVKTMYGTHLVTKPVILKIVNGKVVDISGGTDIARKLSDTLDWAEKKSRHDWGVRRIGELGIGINPRAGIVGPTILNEKTKGTAHIAIGSNAWFGGSIYSIIHLDQVFRNPKIWVDGRLISV